MILRAVTAVAALALATFVVAPARADVLEIGSNGQARWISGPNVLQVETTDLAWQEVYLLSKLVRELRAAGTIPGPGECYAIAPPAPFGGPNPMGGDDASASQVMVMGMGTWQSICAQAVRSAAED